MCTVLGRVTFHAACSEAGTLLHVGHARLTLAALGVFPSLLRLCLFDHVLQFFFFEEKKRS